MKNIFQMETSDFITLFIALWGAVLATFEWLNKVKEKRNKLKLWFYWGSNGYISKIQNIGSKPTRIIELSSKGGFMNEFWQNIFGIKNEEFMVEYPTNKKLEPIILAPNDVYLHEHKNLWEQIDEFEKERREKIYNNNLSSYSYLPLKFIKVLCKDEDGKIHSSEPFILNKESSAIPGEDQYTFRAHFKIPESYGPRKTPFLVRIGTKLFNKTVPSHQIIDEKSLKSAFENKSDDELLGVIAKKIFERPNFNIKKIPDHEKTIAVIMTSDRVIEDGGLEHFFSDDFPDIKGY